MLRVTHVGGKRLRKSDASYRVLRNWIYEGARPDPEGTPKCRKIVVYPGPSRVLRMPDAQKQLSVLAHFPGGRTRDVTRIATFDSTNKEVATVDADGLVVGRQRGLAAVTVRYLDFVESIYFTVEQAVDGFAWNEPVENGPIDRLVNAKLRQMQYLPSNVCDDTTFITASASGPDGPAFLPKVRNSAA